MSYIALMFAVSLTTFLVAKILNRMSEKWSALPRFVCHYVGGMLAVCSIVDYNEALRRNSTVGGLVVVPETIVFSDYSAKERWISGQRAGAFVANPAFRPAPEVENLFVPFASEAHLSFTEQEKIFIGPQNPLRFIEEKWSLLKLHDSRVRYCESRVNSFVGYLQWWSLFFSVLILLVLVVSVRVKADAEKTKEQVTIYTTDANGVNEAKMTRNETRRVLVFDTGEGGHQLTHGTVSRYQLVGEGLERACIIRWANKLKEHCGFAPSTMKIGDEVYLRYAEVMGWADQPSDGQFVRHYDNGSWLITKKEAEALLATGKFHLVE